jgi:hypothetical protein
MKVTTQGAYSHEVKFCEAILQSSRSKGWVKV